MKAPLPHPFHDQSYTVDPARPNANCYYAFAVSVTSLTDVCPQGKFMIAWLKAAFFLLLLFKHYFAAEKQQKTTSTAFLSILS